MSLFRLLPACLIAARLVIAGLLLLDALDGAAGLWFVPGLALALLSDIFDGVIARRLKIVTPALRTADSWVDNALLVSVFASLWLARQGVLQSYSAPIVWNLIGYLLYLLVPLVKFRRLSAYHAYSAKASGALLFAAVLALFLVGDLPWLTWAALLVTLWSDIECVLITLILPVWRSDVPSLWHAWKLRHAEGVTNVT